MIFIILGITVGLIWLHLIALGLLGGYFLKDYAVARLATPLAFGLLFFFIEHFAGLGAKLWFLPFTSAASGYLLWRSFQRVRQNWVVEAAFGAGLLYCLFLRYTFPNIDTIAERIPDFVLIQSYFSGGTLPTIDRWIPPFKTDVYYSFQHYCAALLGRWFKLDSAFTYQIAYCVVAGTISCGIFMTARRLIQWKPAAWLVTLALFLGGTGLGPVIHLSLNHYIEPIMMVAYLGTVWAPNMRTGIGEYLFRHMYTSLDSTILPVDPLSFVIIRGEFHPPLFGFVLLSFSLLVIASIVGEESGRQRGILSGCLAATIPLSIIGNTWIFPLQTGLVLGWFIYAQFASRNGHWRAGLVGLAVAFLLAFPFISGLLQHSSGQFVKLRVTPKANRATAVEWLSVFWPLVSLMVLALWNRTRQHLGLFFIALLAVLLAGTELFYIHDVYAGTWERFNSTLKWWGWIYALGILGLGVVNLNSQSRFCRFASLLVILLPCAQTYDFARAYIETPKREMGHLEGSYWITRDDALRDIVARLKVMPDGICLESGVTFANTEASVIAMFGEKMLYMGWPVQENIWRGFPSDIRNRVQDIDEFYSGKMADPLAWLTSNHIRYVLWLQRDNINLNERFLPIWNKIRPGYTWYRYVGNDKDWALGFWERNEPP